MLGHLRPQEHAEGHAAVLLGVVQLHGGGGGGGCRYVGGRESTALAQRAPPQACTRGRAGVACRHAGVAARGAGNASCEPHLVGQHDALHGWQLGDGAHGEALVHQAVVHKPARAGFKGQAAGTQVQQGAEGRVDEGASTARAPAARHQGRSGGPCASTPHPASQQGTTSQSSSSSSSSSSRPPAGPHM